MLHLFHFIPQPTHLEVDLIFSLCAIRSRFNSFEKFTQELYKTLTQDTIPSKFGSVPRSFEEKSLSNAPFYHGKGAIRRYRLIPEGRPVCGRKEEKK